MVSGSLFKSLVVSGSLVRLNTSVPQALQQPLAQLPTKGCWHKHLASSMRVVLLQPLHLNQISERLANGRGNNA